MEGRPALLVRQGRIEIPRSGIWTKTLMAARALLEPRLAAIGRLDVNDQVNGSRHEGTAWMVAPGIVVTNSHVAEAFAARSSSTTFTFRLNFQGRRHKSNIDFGEEYVAPGSPEPEEIKFDIESVLYMRESRDPKWPDLAVLKLKTNSAPFPTPLPLARSLH